MFVYPLELFWTLKHLLSLHFRWSNIRMLGKFGQSLLASVLDLGVIGVKTDFYTLIQVLRNIDLINTVGINIAAVSVVYTI